MTTTTINRKRTTSRPTPRKRTFAVEIKNGALTREEAEQLTARIRDGINSVWRLVTEAHDRKAWVAMGYPTWAGYCKGELKMSESRSYQLIDVGHVVRLAQQVLTEKSTVSNMLEDDLVPTTREAAKVKTQLPALRRELRKVDPTTPPREALRAAIAALPDPKPKVKAEVVPVQRKPRKKIQVPQGMTLCPRCEGLGYV